MALNISEANAAQLVIAWAIKAGAGGTAPSAQVSLALVMLAERSHKALGAGLSGPAVQGLLERYAPKT